MYAPVARGILDTPVRTTDMVELHQATHRRFEGSLQREPSKPLLKGALLIPQKTAQPRYNRWLSRIKRQINCCVLAIFVIF